MAVFVMLVMLKWNIYSIVVGNIVFSLCMCILNAHSIQTAVGYHQEVKRTFLLPTMAAFLMGVVSYLVFKLFDVLIGGRVFPILFGACGGSRDLRSGTHSDRRTYRRRIVCDAKRRYACQDFSKITFDERVEKSETSKKSCTAP